MFELNYPGRKLLNNASTAKKIMFNSTCHFLHFMQHLYAFSMMFRGETYCSNFEEFLTRIEWIDIGLWQPCNIDKLGTFLDV